MRTRESIVAAVIIAVIAAAGGCGGLKAMPKASAPSSLASASTSAGTPDGAPGEPPRAGYKGVGSSTLGVWFAVPDRWAAMDLAKISASKALRRLPVKGMSSSIMKALLTQLSQRHAFFAADPASLARSPVSSLPVFMRSAYRPPSRVPPRD